MNWPRRDLVNFAASIVGRQDAEDVVQDVAVQVLEAGLPSYVHAAYERSWLFRLTKHACIDFVRRSGTHPVLAFDDLPAPPAVTDPTGDRERLWDASRLLGDLTAEECDWLAAYAYYGTYEAAAEALGMPFETFRGRLWRVREKLRQEAV
jgi:RNA polymerase sigma factor (sigma-70 family)